MSVQAAAEFGELWTLALHPEWDMQAEVGDPDAQKGSKACWVKVSNPYTPQFIESTACYSQGVYVGL